MNLEQKVDNYKYLLTENGRAELAKIIAKFKIKYGENWIREIKTDYPFLTDVLNLAANYDAETAFSRLKEILTAEIESYFAANKKKTTGFFETMTESVKEGAFRTAAVSFLDDNKLNVFKLHAELKTEIDKPRF